MSIVENSTFVISRQRRIAAWLVHLFTASGAVFGLLALWAIHEARIIFAFWFMSVAVIIDAVDGVMARWAQTKVVVPKIDGALLDNMVDYFTYVMVPAFFLLTTDLLPPGWGVVGVSVLVLTSAFQFSLSDYKTDDHFFTGFPSYWNILVFYLFLLQMSAWANLFVVLLFSLLIFVPIKYLYISRLDYLSPNHWLRRGVFMATLVWGGVTAAMIIIYPKVEPLFVVISVGYAILYIVASLYRTFKPMEHLNKEGG